MNSFYRPTTGRAAPMQPAANLLTRRPTRITFTAHWELQQRLQRRADAEGRSLSNLISFFAGDSNELALDLAHAPRP